VTSSALRRYLRTARAQYFRRRRSQTCVWPWCCSWRSCRQRPVRRRACGDRRIHDKGRRKTPRCSRRRWPIAWGAHKAKTGIVDQRLRDRLTSRSALAARLCYDPGVASLAQCPAPRLLPRASPGSRPGPSNEKPRWLSRSNHPNECRHKWWTEGHGRQNCKGGDGKRHSGVVDHSETHLHNVVPARKILVIGNLIWLRPGCDGHHKMFVR
jgi:hypothetical protein